MNSSEPLVVLITTADKAGIVEFCQELINLPNLPFTLLSAGGTRDKLLAADLPVDDLDRYTGGYILEGRIRTISREVAAALLCRDTPNDRADMAKMPIKRIHLVLVDTYDLLGVMANPEATFFDFIEKIDIGGPFLLIEAIKGGALPLCDAADRRLVLHQLRHHGMPKLWGNFHRRLAAKAMRHVANFYRAAEAGLHYRDSVEQAQANAAYYAATRQTLRVNFQEHDTA